MPDNNAVVNYNNIPEELKERRQWVCYSLEIIEDRQTKVPRNWNGGARARTDDPATWGTFDQCLSSLQASARYAGIGYIVCDSDPYTVIDLDHCVDASTGEISADARRIILDIDSYAEFSQSGHGVHIIAEASKPGLRCRSAKRPDIEIYDHHRFLVMTGNLVPGNAGRVQPAPNEITAFYSELFAEQDAERTAQQAQQSTRGKRKHSPECAALDDDELLRRAIAARNGRLFAELWHGNTAPVGGDHSAADLALCNLLAFWTGADAAHMDRLFRQSGLFRDKWDSKRPDGTYGSMTIARALSDCTEF